MKKTKRTVFGIFGKFVADLFNMPFCLIVVAGNTLPKN